MGLRGYVYTQKTTWQPVQSCGIGLQRDAGDPHSRRTARGSYYEIPTIIQSFSDKYREFPAGATSIHLLDREE